MADHLVRTGRRLAEMMDAPWTVANVERPGRPPPSALALSRVNDAMKLGEQLGAATIVLTADNIVTAVADYCAKQQRHPAGHRQVARQPLARGARALVRQRA